MRKLYSVGRPMVLVTAVLLLGAVGCSKQDKVQSEAAQLEKAFAPAGAQGPSDSVQTQVNAALAAIKANDPATALATLEALRKQPGLTAEQRMAVNDAAGQVERALIQRAVAGDAQAKAALDRMRRAADRR